MVLTSTTNPSCLVFGQFGKSKAVESRMGSLYHMNSIIEDTTVSPIQLQSMSGMLITINAKSNDMAVVHPTLVSASRLLGNFENRRPKNQEEDGYKTGIVS